MVKRLRSRFLSLAVLCCLGLGLASCGGDSGTNGGGSTVTIYWQAVNEASDGSWSLTFQGRDYSNVALQSLQLKPGTYEMTGSVKDITLLDITFGGGGPITNAGGVESGSIVSVSGPLLSVSSCGIGYGGVLNPASGSFHFRFTVTSSASNTC